MQLAGSTPVAVRHESGIRVASARPALLEEYLKDARARVMNELSRWLPKRRRYRAVLYDLMLEYPLRSAKALRPALCIATCRALGGQLEAVLPTAAILELYHNAFLIHDDVEDDSERRRDGPTLHRAHGLAVAVNVGDAMLATALPPLLDNMRLVGVGKSLRILELIARMARESAEGQALELAWIRDKNFAVSELDYLRMIHKKTAWYTFIAPVLIGSVLAGARDATTVQLRRFASALGMAFQIQDDVLNLEAGGGYGKDALGDLWEGKRTLLLLHMLRSADEAERRVAMDLLALPRADAPPRREERWPADASLRGQREVEWLLRLMKTYGSVEFGRQVASRAAQRAARCLDRAALAPTKHREFLCELVRFTVDRDH